MYYLFLVLTRNDTFLGHSGTWTTRMQYSIPSFNFQLSTPSPKSNTNRASSEWHLTRNGYCLNRPMFFKIRANCTRTNLETFCTNININWTVPGASDQLWSNTQRTSPSFNPIFLVSPFYCELSVHIASHRRKWKQLYWTPGFLLLPSRPATPIATPVFLPTSPSPSTPPPPQSPFPPRQNRSSSSDQPTPTSTSRSTACHWKARLSPPVQAARFPAVRAPTRPSAPAACPAPTMPLILLVGLVVMLTGGCWKNPWVKAVQCALIG